MRALSLAFLVVFFAFSALPAVAMLFGFAPAHALNGVVKEPEAVALTAGSYFRVDFQQAFERRFEAALGFRGQFVRADNELNLRLFRQLGMDARNSMILGKDDFLFGREYVDAYLARDAVPTAELETKVRRLAFVQSYLASRGKTLLVVITPNKASLYPEYLPEPYRKRRHPEPSTNYERFAPLLTKYGINTIDAQAYLSERKATVPFTYITNSGIHWNDPAACEIVAQILATIAEKLERPLQRLGCTPYVMEDVPHAPDIDLLRVANLWFEDRLYRPAPYASPKLVGRRAPPLSMLIVGGSFVDALLTYLNRYKLADTTFYRYYTSEHRRGRSKPLDPKRLDFESSVFSKQVLLLEVNAEVVQHVGWGILEDAERVIRATP